MATYDVTLRSNRHGRKQRRIHCIGGLGIAVSFGLVSWFTRVRGDRLNPLFRRSPTPLMTQLSLHPRHPERTSDRDTASDRETLYTPRQDR